MGIYIIKSLHSNWIKVGHHLITEKRPSVYYRFINRGLYSVIRPKEIEDKVCFNDLELIYWFNNLNLSDEKKLHKELRLLYEYKGEWYKYENLNNILNIIYTEYNGYLQMPSSDELIDALKWRDDLKKRRGCKLIYSTSDLK
jgi:hypothetical protein